ncbi:tRNA (guanosine(46)-N7)-methyltransferase TrmB [Pseudofrancisella aestuarii]|uniref:tRNA (guanine-N(7)-)-methyltransferase n=1 Tax=Pseudofrancisella aestuarii TaxID=2670347 RepID=A0ABV9TB18_9GAMM|nr:tRNA (guanosine(46)-N7)-methyltransferase TrmB [Pseudofrancisella aestuarii]
MSEQKQENLRQVKSFVRRTGRVTKKQQSALDNFSEKYMLLYDANNKINFKKIFNNDNDVILEIGFGMGFSLVQMALESPSKNYFGIEVHKAGVGNIIHEIEENKISNLLIMNHDAIEVFKNNLKDGSLSGIQIYFPDPWHKTKHNKRRLVNKVNLELFASKIKVGGVLHFASDWLPYAKEVLKLLEADESFENMYEGFAPRPEWRPLTKFEKRGQNLEHPISDILFKRI